MKGKVSPNARDWTDKQLQLAIAEIIAEEKGWTLHLAKSGGSDYWLTGARIRFVPNYPVDNNAALGLLDEFEFVKIQMMRTDDDHPNACFVAVYDQEIGKGVASAKTLSRAISEAVYAAMKEK